MPPLAPTASQCRNAHPEERGCFFLPDEPILPLWLRLRRSGKPGNVSLVSVGQYGPTPPGRDGIDGIYGNGYSVTYEASMCGSALTLPPQNVSLSELL